MKGPWRQLLNIVEQIDGTPCEDLAGGPDVVIDLNCWLMDHEELSAILADAAPDLLAALEAVEWIPTADPNWVRCEWCGIVRFKPKQSLTHKPDCQRQAAITKATGSM